MIHLVIITLYTPPFFVIPPDKTHNTRISFHSYSTKGGEDLLHLGMHSFK